MTTTKIYTYLGTNGTITTSIHLENIYSVVHYKLTADDNYQLIKDNITFYKTVTINPDELNKWKEVPGQR